MSPCSAWSRRRPTGVCATTATEAAGSGWRARYRSTSTRWWRSSGRCGGCCAGTGCCWLNYGDAYAANRGYQVTDSKHRDVGNSQGSAVPNGMKPKDLLMLPARVALALQADGWVAALRDRVAQTEPDAGVGDGPADEFA